MAATANLFLALLFCHVIISQAKPTSEIQPVLVQRIKNLFFFMQVSSGHGGGSDSAMISAAPAPAPGPRHGGVDCGKLCDRRCGLHSRRNTCARACGTCCVRCGCVPPGTAGNREVCGKCYTDMRTHGNRTKCP